MKGYELVNFCEFDTPAVKSYCAIHNVPESKNLGDITLVDENSLDPFNMICGGSPCQDFSVAGKLKGAKWICKDCGEEYNPLYVHWSKRDNCPHCNSDNLDKTRSSLLVEWLRIIRANKPNWGVYENVKNLVGKQFKETTFKMFLDELKEYGYNTYWKVLDAKDYGIPQHRERIYLILIKNELDNGKFVFPESITLTRALKDMLEKEVDEKYYLSDMQIESIRNSSYVQNTRRIQEKDWVDTLCARDWKDPKCVRTEDSISNNSQDERVRKLIPLECWRLMGFSDEDFRKAEKLNSNTQLYKQAGNSIVVDVLYYIYVELYKTMPYLFDELKVGSYFSGIGAFEKALDRLYEGINTGNFTHPQED